MLVVIAAMIAPVSSYMQSFSVIAARMTASCHSSGTASARDQCCQYSAVRSSKSRAVSAMPVAIVSSTPNIRLAGRSSRWNVSSRM